jgi:hypothetical protein
MWKNQQNLIKNIWDDSSGDIVELFQRRQKNISNNFELITFDIFPSKSIRKFLKWLVGLISSKQKQIIICILLKERNLSLHFLFH